MTKKGFYYAGALTIAIGGAACAVQPVGSGPGSVASAGEPMRLAQVETYVVNKNSEPTALTAYRVGRCNENAASCVNKVTPRDGCSKDPMLVVLDFDDLHVAPRNKKPLPMIWPLIGSKWKYQANGIRFYAPGSTMVNKGSGSQGWVHINNAVVGGGFNYEIRVENTDTGEKCVRDPSVVNDW